VEYQEVLNMFQGLADAVNDSPTSENKVALVKAWNQALHSSIQDKNFRVIAMLHGAGIAEKVVEIVSIFRRGGSEGLALWDACGVESSCKTARSMV